MSHIHNCLQQLYGLVTMSRVPDYLMDILLFTMIRSHWNLCAVIIGIGIDELPIVLGEPGLMA